MCRWGHARPRRSTEDVPARREVGQMKTFACGAVVPGCTAEFAAETEAGLFEQIAHHAREEHGLDEVPEELIRQVRANIR
jgi:predicted small metal-binding protein